MMFDSDILPTAPRGWGNSYVTLKKFPASLVASRLAMQADCLSPTTIPLRVRHFLQVGRCPPNGVPHLHRQIRDSVRSHGVFVQEAKSFVQPYILVLGIDGFMHRQSFSMQPHTNCHGSGGSDGYAGGFPHEHLPLPSREFALFTL